MSRELVCYCFEVSKEEIVSIIRQHKTRTVEEIQKYCKASMGCGSCRPNIEELIVEEFSKMK